MSSRFEFLGKTSMGQYIPRHSWFHQRDPRARLLSFITLFIGVTMARDFLGIGFGFVAVLLIFVLSKVPFKQAWYGIKRALPIILILAVLQILFSSQLESERILWTIFGFDLTQSAGESAVMLVVKFLLLITLLNGLTMSISTAQITSALFYLLKPFEKLGFPVNDLTMVVQITLRYLPLFAQLAEKTAKAQAARGGDWEKVGFNPVRQAKRVLPLFVPLIVNSLKRAETMAVAMESRGFNAADKRSSFYAMKFTWNDAILLLFSVALSTTMIITGWVL